MVQNQCLCFAGDIRGYLEKKVFKALKIYGIYILNGVFLLARIQ